MTTKPDLTRTWAVSAPGGNVIDPDATTPGKYAAGWVAEVPPFEHFNFLQQLMTQGLAHNNEQGINVWDTETPYPVDGLAKGSDGKLHVSQIPQSGNDPVGDDGTNWSPFLLLFDTVSSFITTSGLGASSPAGIVVDFKGYHSKGDVGASKWITTGNIIGASLSPADLNTAKMSDPNGNECTLIPDISPNVRQFGAVGDGILGGGATDDGPAIQAAIQGTDGAGGQLLFPQGNYMIRTQVNLLGAFRKLKGEGLAVGIPGCRLMTDIEDFGMVVLNGETYAIENIAFIGPGLTRTGAGGGIGLHMQTSGGAVQTDDARLDNCWFAGWKESSLKAPRLQGAHILNCTFEFSGNGIDGGDGSVTSEFRNNILNNNRFFRNIRGLSIIGDTTASPQNSLAINNIISNNIFDISGDSGFIGDQSGLYMHHANFNVVSNNQFPTNEFQDIIMDTCAGNIIDSIYSFRAGRQSLLIKDSQDISVTNYKAQNYNNEFGTHATDFAAIEIDNSTVDIDGVQAIVYGVVSSDHTIKLKNSSTVNLSRTNLTGFNVAKYTKDAGSSLEDITPESGTFTPIIVGSTTAGVHTYSVQNAQYRRTGKSVFFKLSVLLTAKDVGMAGNVEIHGLPFTAETATAESQFVVKYNDVAITSSNELTASATSNTTILNLYRPLVGAGQAAFALDSSQVGDNTRLDISGVYLTSDL